MLKILFRRRLLYEETKYLKLSFLQSPDANVPTETKEFKTFKLIRKMRVISCAARI